MGFPRRNSENKLEVKIEIVDEFLLQETKWKPSTHEVLIMVSLSIISFMVALDSCIIVTSLSAIVKDLHGTATQGFWVGTSYLLSMSVAMPLLASISEIFSRPALLVFSVLIFTTGSVICASAPNIGSFLGGRSVQGIGGGGIVVLSLVIFTDIVPLRFRPKWYGTVQGAWALGNCAGPVLGGLIAEKTTWRWVFYVMFPFCAFGLIIIPFLLPLKARTDTINQKLARVDWIGSFMFMSSATSFLIAVSWGGMQFAWSSAGSLLPLVIGSVGLLATAAWERFMAPEPFLRHSLFHNLSAVATYLCSAIQGLVLFGQLYYVPFYMMSVLAYSPIHTGLALLPVVVTLVPASIATGILISRFNSYLWPIWGGWVMVTIGCGLMNMFDADTHIAVWVATLIILGLGHGSILNAQSFACQATCDSGDEPRAAAMYAFMRHFGTALGVGIGGSTFQNAMALKLDWLGLPADIAKNAEAYISSLLAMPASPEKTGIIQSYVFGFRGVYGLYMGLSGIAFFISLLITTLTSSRHYNLNNEISTEHRLQDNRLSKIVDSRLNSARKSRMRPRTSSRNVLSVLECIEEGHGG